MDTHLPVVVVGAGPVGLAAAAHLHERGLPFVVFEAGDGPGAAVRQWGHVRLFSPWALNVDRAARRLLDEHGWVAPDGRDHPTGKELVERYLDPLGAVPAIAAALRPGRRVVAVTRAGVDKLRTDGRGEVPFVVTTEGPGGTERTPARAVLDASGTWATPNPLGADGRPAPGEAVARAAGLVDDGIPDVLGAGADRYRTGPVDVVGSGHSAQNVVRDLAALGPDMTVTWVVRRPDPRRLFGGGAGDQLPERGRLGAEAQALVAARRVRLEAGFRVEAVATEGDGVALVAGDGRRLGPFRRVVAATGFRPDFAALSELRLDVDPALESARALAPLIDPNVHTCGSVPPHGAAELAHPEPGLFVVGAKSYGRAPTFLLATGYEQVRSVAAALAGDRAAARADCSVGRRPEDAGAAACG